MYVIEKAIRRYSQYDTSDTIVEYAMCMDCNEGLKDSFSEISQKRLEQYFEENIDYDRRVDLLQDIREDNVEILLSKCAIKNTSADESEHYQLLAICKGEDLVVHLTPFMLSEKALDEMTDLLSNQTIGAIDDFIGQFLGLPPEFEDINKKLFLI
jgi:hypothetical protein